MKETYFKYSLVALILLLGWVVVSELWMFINGLLGAFTVFLLVSGQMTFLTEKWKMKSIFAAIIILIEVITCVFVPLYFLVWLLISRIQDVNVDITQLIETVKHLSALIQEKTQYDLLSGSNIETAASYLTKSIQLIISHVGGLLVTTIVMLFFLYFMLMMRKDMEAFVHGLLPFSEDNKNKITREVILIVRSNAIGIPILAIIHGTAATIGFWIVGVPNFMLLGILAGLASIIPFISSSIVWVPYVIYLALIGNWFAAIGLLAFCLIVLVNIDNVIRFILQKKLADIHPLITVFGVILGLKLFGFWGIIFGPLLLSLFFLLLNIFKKEFLDKK